MLIKVSLACLMFVCLSSSIPTIYKYNENKALEADLIPVSSTVIPLSVYEVSAKLHVSAASTGADGRVGGPVSLLTAQKKKKVELTRVKLLEESSVRQIES